MESELALIMDGDDSDSEIDWSEIEVDYYALLNVERDATSKEIRQSFRQLSTTFHPDRQQDPEEKALSTKTFNQMAHAKDILTNPVLRRAYDDFGLEGVDFISNTSIPELQSYQVGSKYRDLDALPKLLRKHLELVGREDKSSEVGAIGDMEMKLDGRGVFEEVLAGEFPDLPTVHSYAITHMFQLHPTNQDLFLPYGKVFVQITPSSQTVHSISGFQWTHRISKWMSFLMNGEVGLHSLAVEAFVVRKLFDSQNVQVGIHIDYNDGIDFSIKTNREVFGIGDSTLDLKIGTDENISWDIDLSVGEWDYSGGIDFAGFDGGAQTGIHIRADRQLGEEKGSNFFIHGRMNLSHILFLEYGLTRPMRRKEEKLTFSVSASLTRGLTAQIKVHRSNVNLRVPVLLTEDSSVQSFFLAMTIPVALHFARNLLTTWWSQRLKRRKLEQLNEEGLQQYQALQDAADVRTTLARSAKQNLRTEKRENGLVIEAAYYGPRLMERLTEENIMMDLNADTTEDNLLPSYIDVKIPLQYLVRDSGITLDPVNFSTLHGFCDPAPLETKFLLIFYTFNGESYRAYLPDGFPVLIPSPIDKL